MQKYTKHCLHIRFWHIWCSGTRQKRQKVSSLKSLFTYLGSKDYPVSSGHLWLCLAQIRFDNLLWIRGAGRITKITKRVMRSHMATLDVFHICLSYVYLMSVCRWSWAGGKCLCMWVCAPVCSQVSDQPLLLISRVSYPSGKISANWVWNAGRDQEPYLEKNEKSVAEILCSWPSRYV